MTSRDALEELFNELYKDPEFQKEYWRQKPYYDLLLEIKKRRKELNLTQEELAQKSGTHQGRISKIESGEHNIRLNTLIEIAEALDSKVEIHLVPNYQIDDDDYRKLLEISATNASPRKQTVHSIVNIESLKA